GDKLATEFKNWLFACGINVDNNNTVFIIKGASEFITQRFGSRKTMRLEHRQHAFVAGRFRRLKRGANFRGMMRVIIDEQKTIAGVLYFKPAPGVLEFAEGSCNFLERDPKFIR